MAGDLAGMFEHLAAAVAQQGATAAAGAAGSRFLNLELPHVPVHSGALRRSFRMSGPAGGGTHAVSTVGSHGCVYAEIQNTGGVIHVKNARVLTNGEAFFGKQVTIPGQHYWTLDGKQGAITAAAERAVQVVVNRAV